MNDRSEYHVFSKMFQPPALPGPEALCDLLAASGCDGVQWTVRPGGHVEPSRAIDTGVPMLVATRQGHLPGGIIDRDGAWIAQTLEDGGFAWADVDLAERKRTFWLSVGPGEGDPYQLYLDESRPALYERQDLRQPRR